MSTSTTEPLGNDEAAVESTDDSTTPPEGSATEPVEEAPAGESASASESDREPEEGDGDETVEGEDDLGDAGKKALKSMKEERNKARARARELEAEVARLREAPDADKVREQVRAEVRAEADKRLLNAELRAAAKGVLADPGDALRYPEVIDLSSFEVGDDGVVDTDALGSAINSLVERKPYLAVQDGKRFQGSADGGARKDSTPATLDEQIAEAERGGDSATAGRLKAQRLVELRNQSHD